MPHARLSRVRGLSCPRGFARAAESSEKKTKDIFHATARRRRIALRDTDRKRELAPTGRRGELRSKDGIGRTGGQKRKRNVGEVGVLWLYRESLPGGSLSQVLIQTDDAKPCW
jgi:hypothetical protein